MIAPLPTNIARVLLLAALLVPGTKARGDEISTTAWAERLLARHGIGTEPDALVEWLRNRVPGDEFRERFDAAVGRLGNAEFREREAAMRELAAMGSPIVPRLKRLAESPDPEVRRRVQQVLDDVRSGRADPLGEPLTLAVLRILRDRPRADLVPLLLEAIPDFPRGSVHDAACEVVWRSCGPEHRDLVEQMARRNDPEPVSLVAYEAVAGAEAIPTLERHVESEDADLRLAAARALAVRSPKLAFVILVGLTNNPDPDVVRRVRTLLTTINAGGGAFAERRWMVDDWDTVFVEHFVTNEPVAFWEEFRDLRTRSMTPVQCRVETGVLRLPASGAADSDVMVELDLEKAFGKRTPRVLRVLVEVGSDGDSPVAWHPAIAIGRLKFLFHPGYATGAFRIEDLDSHSAHVQNTNMGHTPRTNVFHRVEIVATAVDEGEHAFHVVVWDPTEPTARFEYGADGAAKFGVAATGPLNRVSLVRSGRVGGVAQFRSLVLQVPRVSTSTDR